MTSATLTTAERLARELSDPVGKQQVANVLGIGIAGVYDSMRRFDAARIAGDIDAMRREVPCLHRGGARQKDGTYRGGRYVVPRDAFIRYYVSAGLDESVLAELYGAP
jgi:hypothetical protein